MSYGVQLFRKETKELAEAAGNVGAFLESRKGLKAFTGGQIGKIFSHSKNFVGS